MIASNGCDAFEIIHKALCDQAFAAARGLNTPSGSGLIKIL
jgi:hypothetical protein